MRSKLVIVAGLMLALAGCGGDDGSDGTGGEHGPGGAGGDAMGGSGGTGSGGTGAGGTGGSGGTGGTDVPAPSWIDIDDDTLLVPLHGTAPIGVRIDREVVGGGDVRISLDGTLPEGVWASAVEDGGDEPFAGIAIDAGETEAVFFLRSDERVAALDAPTTIALRGTTENWSGDAEVRVQVAALVTSDGDAGAGTLRALIPAASALQPNPTIRFAPWIFPSDGAHTIVLERLLEIEGAVVIEGPLVAGRPIVTLQGGVDSNDASRVMHVGFNRADDTVTYPVEIKGLRMTNMRNHGSQGGCILNSVQLALEDVVIEGCYGGSGAGVYSTGDLTVRRSLIRRNSSSGGGGGIYSDGPLRVEQSAIVENTAKGSGGGLFVRSDTKVINTTVAANRADDGGGIAAMSAAVDVAFSTIHGNTAALDIDDPTVGQGGGAHLAGSSALSAVASIFAGNVAGRAANDVYLASGNTMQSTGYNLVGDFSSFGLGDASGMDEESDLLGDAAVIDAALGSLVDNGGPTPTLLPHPGSPAIDHVPAAACTVAGAPITADQRGMGRPAGDGCDIGAAEVR